MNVSVEMKTENDHFSKVDNKVKNTKTKQSNGNQDSKRTESSSAQEGQMTDDIGRLVTTKMVALWNSSFAPFHYCLRCQVNFCDSVHYALQEELKLCLLLRLTHMFYATRVEAEFKMAPAMNALSIRLLQFMSRCVLTF